MSHLPRSLNSPLWADLAAPRAALSQSQTLPPSGAACARAAGAESVLGSHAAPQAAPSGCDPQTGPPTHPDRGSEAGRPGASRSRGRASSGKRPGAAAAAASGIKRGQGRAPGWRVCCSECAGGGASPGGGWARRPGGEGGARQRPASVALNNADSVVAGPQGREREAFVRWPVKEARCGDASLPLPPTGSASCWSRSGPDGRPHSTAAPARAEHLPWHPPTVAVPTGRTLSPGDEMAEGLPGTRHCPPAGFPPWPCDVLARCPARWVQGAPS